jgi:hypothetical protein
MVDNDRLITSITSALNNLNLQPSLSEFIRLKKERKWREAQDQAREAELRRLLCKWCLFMLFNEQKFKAFNDAI